MSASPSTKVGEQLAQHQLAGTHGRREQLFHGAVFPFARDGQRTEHGRDDHHGDGDQSGDDEVLRFEVAVVPDADARLDGHSQRLPAVADLRVRPKLRGIALHDGVGVAERDATRCWNRCRRPEAARRLPRRPADAANSPAAPRCSAGWCSCRWRARWPCSCSPMLQNLEVARAAELIDQVAAFGRVVLIVDVGGDPVDVQRQRVAEQQQHHQRQRERERQAAESRTMCSSSFFVTAFNRRKLMRLSFLPLRSWRRRRLPWKAGSARAPGL